MRLQINYSTLFTSHDMQVKNTPVTVVNFYYIYIVQFIRISMHLWLFQKDSWLLYSNIGFNKHDEIFAADSRLTNVAAHPFRSAARNLSNILLIDNIKYF